MKFTEEQIKKIEACSAYVHIPKNTVAAAMQAGLLPEVLVSVAELVNATTKKECHKLMDECPVFGLYPLIAAYHMGYMQRTDLEAAKLAMNLTDRAYGIPKEFQLQDVGDMEQVKK